MENIVLAAVRENPKIIRQIIADPDNHLNYHRMSSIEYIAIENIERQAFGKRRWAVRSHSRHVYYSRFLNDEEKAALTFEANTLKNSWIRGVEVYKEVARLMSIKFRSHYDWRHVKSILEFASEVIADIELNSYLNGKNLANIAA